MKAPPGRPQKKPRAEARGIRAKRKSLVKATPFPRRTNAPGTGTPRRGLSFFSPPPRFPPGVSRKNALAGAFCDVLARMGAETSTSPPRERADTARRKSARGKSCVAGTEAGMPSLPNARKRQAPKGRRLPSVGFQPYVNGQKTLCVLQGRDCGNAFAVVQRIFNRAPAERIFLYGFRRAARTSSLALR